MRLLRYRGAAVLLGTAVAFLAASHAGARDLSEAAEARSTMRRAISCVADDDVKYRRGRGLLAVAESKWGDEAFAELRAQLDDCLFEISHEGRSVRRVEFTLSLLRGQILRSIVLEEWGIEGRTALLPEFRRIASAPQDVATNPIGVFGTCVAKLDPENARKAIGSGTADDHENAA